MKVYQVIFRMDDRSKDAKHGAQIDENTFYAANSAEEVWEEIKRFRMDEGMDFQMIKEVLPAMHIIKPVKP